MAEKLKQEMLPPIVELALLPMAVGQAVIEWSHAERNLLRVMTMLRYEPPKKLIDDEYFAARDWWLDRSFDEWKKELGTLASLQEQSDLKSNIEEVIKVFPVALDRRNDIVHGYYGGTSEDGKREYKRKRHKKEQTEKSVSSLEIWDWIKDIRSLLLAVGQIENNISKSEAR